MSPDNPQSGKRGTRTGNRSGNEKSFDQNAQSPSDLGNTTADPLGAGFGATEFGTTTGAPNYGTTGSVGSGRRGGDGDQQTSGILNQVRDKAASQLNEQKTRATDGLGSVAQAVRQSTHHRVSSSTTPWRSSSSVRPIKSSASRTISASAI